MKKITTILFSMFFILVFSCNIFASNTKYSIVDIPAEKNLLDTSYAASTEISGSLPKINFGTENFKNSMNQKIIKSCNDTLTEILKTKNIKKIEFSYKTVELKLNNENYLSIIISANAVNYSSSKVFKVPININVTRNTQAFLNDFLGVNGLYLSYDHIKDTITTNPDGYADIYKELSDSGLGANLKELTSDQNFYIYESNGNKSKLAIIYYGREFLIDLSKVKNYEYKLNDNFNYKDLSSINLELRTIAEYFNFKVEWSNITKSIQVKKDKFFVSLKIGSNEYTSSNGKKILKKAPFIQNGKTYVPIDFFEYYFGTVFSVRDRKLVLSMYDE